MQLFSVGVLAVLAAAQLPAALDKCSQEKVDSARLACYDQEISRLKQASSRAAPATAEDNFGVSGELLRKKQERDSEERPQLQQLESSVVKISQRLRGENVFELANGQVWEQRDASTTFVVRTGDKVKIEEGSLGSFWLANEAGRRTRVKRVR